MYNTDFGIITLERKILDALNTSGLSVITMSLVIDSIKDSLDLKKYEIIKKYEEGEKDDNSTKGNN